VSSSRPSPFASWLHVPLSLCSSALTIGRKAEEKRNSGTYVQGCHPEKVIILSSYLIIFEGMRDREVVVENP
jgi:hypothetical protein